MKTNDFEVGGLLLLLFLVLMHCLPVVLTRDANVELNSSSKSPASYRDEWSSFNKITLGMPISINSESPEALTAVPGIGPQMADRIVKERNKRGGFRRLEDLRSVKGIGPILYEKLRPFLEL